ncbi:MAG: hypothetical protein ACE5D2_00380 [Fidelibacterota bacterium]
MAIDLNNKEGRVGYLQAKLDDLLEGINASYGQALVDELMERLEAAIQDFNEEVQYLMASLKENSTRQEELLKKIKAGEVVGTETSETDQEEESDPKELSEWEKRLEGLK